MSEFKVRYCSDPPKTLRSWCDAHAHQVEEFDSGDGYATESGFAYDILLRRGWRMSGLCAHPYRADREGHAASAALGHGVRLQ